MSYQYKTDRTPEENIAMALYAIATELNNLGMKDANSRLGAIELLASEVKGVRDSLGSIADAMSLGREHE